MARDKMAQAVLGHQPLPGSGHEPLGGAIEGEVVAITANGISFTIRSWDQGKHLFGPAPYTWPRHTTVTSFDDLHSHTVPLPADGPVAGDRCLVIFTDNGPWVIGWWPR